MSFNRAKTTVVLNGKDQGCRVLGLRAEGFRAQGFNLGLRLRA